MQKIVSIAFLFVPWQMLFAVVPQSPQIPSPQIPASPDVPASSQVPVSLRVTPTEVTLCGKYDRAQLIVSSATAGESQERCLDKTKSAAYESSDPKVVRVDSEGRLRAVGNGAADIRVTVNGASRSIPVKVTEVGSSDVDFSKDVRPLLSKAGCAAGACHAAQFGQGGFKLSVFGFDPDADYEAITRSSRGRRIDLARPEASLLLKKPAMLVSHGGGARLEHESVDFQIISDWISSGAPRPSGDTVKVVKIDVVPRMRVGESGLTQQLRVTAHYSDHSERDVTAVAIYDAIDSGVVSVTHDGYVVSVGRGQTSVMIRYDGRSTISTFVIPYGDEVQLANWKNNNLIDRFALGKFRDLGLEPVQLCDDATFVRRAFLDAIGSLPRADVVTGFVASEEPDKRAKLIDRLLGLTGDPGLDIYNDRYAAYWTLKWSDLLRNDSKSLGEQGMWALHNWIKESFRVNKPYDLFVRELVTAKGSIYASGPANFFRVHKNSSALTEATSQLFLGVRLECAKCHHHPFEEYSQADYYSMAAFFSRVGSKNSEEFGLFGRETVVMVRATGEVSHPRTGKRLQPKPLGGDAIDHALDRRIPLAEWMTSPENKFFAKSVVNRYLGYLLGHGLVEPVDDMRSTNPPSNAGMLDALADDFVKHNHDLKQLVRTIMTSRLYGLSSEPTPENLSDRRFYSHYQVKRLTAEPLLDAIDEATGVQTKFRNLPLGTRAIELPDAEYPDYFLNTFAKPRRTSVCECERSPDASLAQALHTLNGDTLAKKISHKEGRVAKLVAAKTPHEEIVGELYLAALCRPPTQAELKASHDFLAEAANPQECYQDLLWALINSKQFLFVR